MLSILTAVLEDTKQLEGDSHIKRAFLFSCIWSIGSLFLQKDQLVFEKFLKTLTVELVHTIQFTYYVTIILNYANFDFIKFKTEVTSRYFFVYKKALKCTNCLIFCSLPDFDQSASIFEYFLDESGDWELFKSRISTVTYVDECLANNRHEDVSSLYQL